MDQPAFIQLLTAAVQNGASDVHLQVGFAPAFRLKGDLVTVRFPVLKEVDLELTLAVMTQDSETKLRPSEIRQFDGSFEVKNLARFRFNIFRNQGKLAAVLRLIPAVIPTIENLGLPSVLKTIASMQRGLVLVTGATGSGKSSTLAAMIDDLNSKYPLHILTIEDPIEFIHTSKRARLSQREVGRDTASFSDALRAALRQDPDIILVGEMRDMETIDIAIKAAETGHMVFSTVHTTDAAKTIGRLVSVFPPEEQRSVRLRLAETITATISQRLLPRLDGKGMVAAQEIMINNTGIAECIADPSLTSQMNDYISKLFEPKKGEGGRTFEQHLVHLFQQKVISLQVAKEFSSNPADFERNLMFGDNPSEKAFLGHGELTLDHPENSHHEIVASHAKPPPPPKEEEEVRKGPPAAPGVAPPKFRKVG